MHRKNPLILIIHVLEKEVIITLQSERLGYGRVVLSNPDKVSIRRGVTVVYGENGSGKTTLGLILERGRYAYGNRLEFADDIRTVKMLSFTDIHTLSGMETQYYAQRLEATANDMVPTVGEILGPKLENKMCGELFGLLGLHSAEEKRINYLSSGELRKLLIINAMLEEPDVLVLDNPYIGLDAGSRDEFDSAMVSLRNRGVSVIMLLCDRTDIPAYADEVIRMDNLRISEVEDFSAADNGAETEEEPFRVEDIPARPEGAHRECDVVFAIRNGHVRYGTKEIFSGLDWEVRRSQSWVLTGRNGSGKSMLLSLVCADNPQAYANDITLFDRKRGSGESIWEIKDSIGYVSPEMQLFFKSNAVVEDVVLQGMRTSLNRYKRATPEELREVEAWLRLLGIEKLAGRRYADLSAGEQRMVLVARAMIKQPELLVLDEPLHGLDAARKRRVRAVTDAMTRRNGSALIFVTHYEAEIPECVTYTKSLSNIHEIR